VPTPLLVPTPAGLYCPPGDFHIDPTRRVPRAVITHGHSDHARKGHGAVLATAETLAVMAVRYGANFAGARQALRYGQRLTLGDVNLRLVPAGHVLGSAQVLIENADMRAVVSGDYKRRADPTCPAFEPVAADLFVTEATFAMPIFVHPPAETEIARLMRSLALFPQRPHVLVAYSLGKAQRLIALLRAAGYDRPIHVAAAPLELCTLYEHFGIRLGPLLPLESAHPSDLAGGIVIGRNECLRDPVVSFASGWMRLRANAKSQGGDLPLIISDHADWPELLQSLDDVGPRELWITHGREDALAHHAGRRGIAAKSLELGFAGESGE